MSRGVLAPVTLLAILLAGGCAAGGQVPTAPTSAPPRLPDAPIPTPGARIRVANIGEYGIPFLWLELPKETVRFGTVASNAVSDYRATTHGAYEAVGFGFAETDVLFGPWHPGQPVLLPSPIAGHAFTYYVRLEFPDQWPLIRTVRITRDE